MSRLRCSCSRKPHPFLPELTDTAAACTVQQSLCAHTVCSACTAAAHASESAAPLAQINLQGTTLSEPALGELCRALALRGSRGPRELNLEGCLRRAPAAPG